MKKMTTLGLCLTMMFALAAVAASGASAALPEWGGCEAAAPGLGKYKDPACLEKATGAAKKTEGDYEWYAGESFGWVHQREHGLEYPFGIEEYQLKPVQLGPITFETTSGKKVECPGTAEDGLGVEIEGRNRIRLQAPNRANGVKLSWAGCHESSGPGEEGAECESADLPYEGYGVVTDSVLVGDEESPQAKLVFVEGKGTENPKVGLELTSLHKPGERYERFGEEVVASGILFEVVCKGAHGIGTVKIGGNKKGKDTIISLITPVDQMVGEGEETTAFSQLFKGTAGIQEPSAPEKGGEEFLDETLENNLERSAWNSTWTDPPEEEAPPIEIKARP